ncbi:MAG: hypothetical protein DRP22_04190 [Verrucomicrobia bacterium]|nr:MAG: hypothetical protein DRP22_04190 [Verrucomicrobiota bacterium]
MNLGKPGLKGARLLVMDVGNTSIAFGLYGGGKVDCMRFVEHGGDVRELQRALQRGDLGPIEGCAVASVVPGLNRGIERLIRNLWGTEIFWVGADRQLGIPISYPQKSRIGADRLANAAAAARIVGLPVIVADFGTALTFDLVLPRRGYVGGIILPGPGVFLECLAEHAALLPRLGPAAVRGAYGRSTEQAMLLGWSWGYPAMVDEVTARLQRAAGGRARLCATGGQAKRIVRRLGWRYRVIPDLTLRGIGMIYEMNADRERL